jgi:hypothetical protein
MDKIYQRANQNLYIKEEETTIFRLFYNQMEGKIDRIHDHSLYWPGTYTSIKSGVVKLVLRAKAKRELKEINKLGENRNKVYVTGQ